MGRSRAEPGLRAALAATLLFSFCGSCAAQAETADGGGELRAPAAAGPAPAPAPGFTSWQQVMADGVGPAYDFQLREGLKPPGELDLGAVAKSAAGAAEAMAQGRKRFGRRDEAEFTKLALEAEAHFRDVEWTAKGGDRVATAKLVTTAEDQHCNRCHDKYQH